MKVESKDGPGAPTPAHRKFSEALSRSPSRPATRVLARRPSPRSKPETAASSPRRPTSRLTVQTERTRTAVAGRSALEARSLASARGSESVLLRAHAASAGTSRAQAETRGEDKAAARLLGEVLRQEAGGANRPDPRPPATASEERPAIPGGAAGAATPEAPVVRTPPPPRDAAARAEAIAAMVERVEAA